MGLFDFWKKKSGSPQQQANKATLDQLRTHGVSDQSELKVEFFFYSPDETKAYGLAAMLKKLDYDVGQVSQSAGKVDEWIVNGWTDKMKMDVASINNWTTRMETIASEFDSEFDGWGTMPDQ